MSDSIAVSSADWWAAVERDGHRCRAAVFLPDLPCTGALTVYDPGDLADANPTVDRAVTACDGHHRWVVEHRVEAAALGLIRSSR